ncbi:MAG: RraA family protein [Planctomycetota bacterium]|jgi:regulator of RNase E activity RraA|nr:RraA family protein [Planctomycetota bacterium]
MTQWKDDGDLFRLMREELYTAVVGDIMDKLGLLRQYLPARITPLQIDMVVAGRAMPVLEADTFGDECGNFNGTLKKTFGLMLEALDDLKENEVYICTGSSPNYALWGELMAMRASRLKAAGAVLDGYSRDTRGIMALGFPTFSHGRYSQDQAPRGKVLDYRVPIEIGGVRIGTGDIVFGDLDGVLIVPRSHEKEVVARSLEKARGERTVAKAIQSGLSARESFAKFGIM